MPDTHILGPGACAEVDVTSGRAVVVVLKSMPAVVVPEVGKIAAVALLADIVGTMGRHCCLYTHFDEQLEVPCRMTVLQAPAMTVQQIADAIDVRKQAAGQQL